MMEASKKRMVRVIRPFFVDGRLRQTGEMVLLHPTAARSKVLTRRAEYVMDGVQQPPRSNPAEVRERKVLAPAETTTQPVAAPQRCRGTTKAGERCRMTGPRVVNGFCDMHADQREE